MPTYEYACKQCNGRLEVVQAFTDDPLTQCPSCSGQLRKVFSAPGISFKGSGFYKNDSRSTPAAEKPSTSSEGTGSSKESGDSAGSGGQSADSSSSESSPSKESGSKAQPAATNKTAASKGSSATGA